MLNTLFFFSALLLAHCFAETFTEEDRKLLSDIPEPTGETLRWAVPADGWRLIPEHLLKGQFFRITTIQKDEGSMKFKLYKDPKLEKKTQFEIDHDILYVNGKWICGEKHLKSYIRDVAFNTKILKCNYATCKPIAWEEFRETPKYYDAEFLYNIKQYQNICPYKINYHIKETGRVSYEKDTLYDVLDLSNNASRAHNYYFQTVGIAKDKSYIEVLVNEEKYYLDIRSCKENPKHCSSVDVKFSDYEKDWIRLNKHQEKKDIEVLNILIAKLKPCVEKRDEACIKKFFPDKVKDEHIAEWYHWDEFPVVTVDDDLIKELKACLDYKNLLPHLYGTKGVNKVCIFMNRGDYKFNEYSRDSAKLLNVAYPEAVRVNKKDSIFLPLK